MCRYCSPYTCSTIVGMKVENKEKMTMHSLSVYKDTLVVHAPLLDPCCLIMQQWAKGLQKQWVPGSVPFLVQLASGMKTTLESFPSSHAAQHHW